MLGCDATACHSATLRLKDPAGTRADHPFNPASSPLSPTHSRFCSAHARARNLDKMADRDILPDNVKPVHYSVSLRDLEFKTWTYKGTVT